ncbi:MAG: GNAT family N-acetyltransferase [Chloroflexota bacterium]
MLHVRQQLVVSARSGPIRLETERLILREFAATDAPAVLAYQSAPEFLQLMPWDEYALEHAQELVAMFLAWQQERPRLKFQLAVTLRSSGRLIGNCGIRSECVDAREATLGYELDPAYWGEGYATEAAMRMLELGFDALGLHRVDAGCIADNTASARVLERLGMRLEGRLREKEHFKEAWHDLLVYALLEQEWRTSRE